MLNAVIADMVYNIFCMKKLIMPVFTVIIMFRIQALNEYGTGFMNKTVIPDIYAYMSNAPASVITPASEEKQIARFQFRDLFFSFRNGLPDKCLL
ncbi:MAG: hypothetical protein U5N56_06250 [Candidatus Marinimicrobia bacterium]|nr:hypothetical protein [Candidatus Neomarinimicrobiota bacterium]